MERRNAHPLAVVLARILRPGRGTAEALEKARAEIVDDARVRRILIVKTHDQLGDFLVATPAIAALRARYPNATIALVVREYLAPLARHVPGVDRLWVLPRVRDAVEVGVFLATLLLIARFRPDLSFVMNSVSRSKTADLLAAWSGARVIVGRSVVGAGALAEAATPERSASWVRTDALYDLDLPFGPGSSHQVDRLLDLVLWTGARGDSRRMRFDLSAEERAAGERRLAAARGSKRVGFHPAAANSLKCWPVESFVELGTALANHPGRVPIELFVLDTPKEPGPAHAVEEGLRARRVPARNVPPLPLDEFATVLAALDLVVCNDSGVMHLAAALGVPTLSIHSLGRPEEWAPQSERAIALHGEPIARVSVEAALAAARSLLA